MIELKNIDVLFRQNKETIQAVKNVDFSVEKGEIFGVVGYSGAGKSSLVRVINLLQRPTNGEVWINGHNITLLKPKELRKQRKKIGMIFQHFNLMKGRSVFDNVDFSLKYSGLTKEDRKRKVRNLLALVGLEEKESAYPNQLSGGQKQRVAIARALANDPEILLCDEATSALDPKTTNQILQLLKKLNQELGLTIVLITHEMQVVKDVCHKVAIMEAGEIIEEGDIIKIFSDPHQPLTRDFIRTATHIDQALETILTHEVLSKINSNQQIVELSYVGDQTNQPIISHLTSKFQVETSILYGNVEIVRETPIGQLVVILQGEQSRQKEALVYLERQGIQTNVLKNTQKNDGLLYVVGGN